MPKGKKLYISVCEGLPGQRVSAGKVVHKKMTGLDKAHEFYPGRECKNVGGDRSNSYGEMIEIMLKKREENKRKEKK